VPSSRASRLAVMSLSMTAHAPWTVPSSARTTGMPPPPQATTMCPSSTSVRMASSSTISRGLGDGYEEQRALLALTTKPTFQWIETGPLEGSCVRPGWPQLSPARVAAEIWLAIAGGARWCTIL